MGKKNQGRKAIGDGIGHLLKGPGVVGWWQGDHLPRLLPAQKGPTNQMAGSSSYGILSVFLWVR